MSPAWLRVARAEGRRVLASPGGKAVLLVPPAAAAARIALGAAFESAGRARGTAQALALGTAPGEARETVSNAYPALVSGLAVGIAAAALLLVVFGALSLAGERDAGTMRVAFTRPVPRASFVLGKAAAGLLLAVLAFPAVALAAAATAGAFHDFGPIAEQGYEIFSENEVRTEILRGVAAASLPVAAAFAFGLLVSAFARSPGPAAATALLGYLVFDAGKGLLGNAAEFVFATFNPSLDDRSYLHHVAAMAQGFSDWEVGGAAFTRNLLVPPLEALLFVAAAVWITRRRDA